MATEWDFRREGRAWSTDEARARYELTPEKWEMWKGKLFWEDLQRINLLGLLIENLGVDAVVRLGPLEVWQEAVAAAQGQPRELAPREPGLLEDDDLEYE